VNIPKEKRWRYHEGLWGPRKERLRRLRTLHREIEKLEARYASWPKRIQRMFDSHWKRTLKEHRLNELQREAELKTSRYRIFDLQARVEKALAVANVERMNVKKRTGNPAPGVQTTVLIFKLGGEQMHLTLEPCDFPIRKSSVLTLGDGWYHVHIRMCRNLAEILHKGGVITAMELLQLGS
jgi:hypothetical protein